MKIMKFKILDYCLCKLGFFILRNSYILQNKVAKTNDMSLRLVKATKGHELINFKSN